MVFLSGGDFEQDRKAKGGAMDKRILIIATVCALALIGVYTLAQQNDETQTQTQERIGSQDTPDTAIIDKIVNLYESVVFIHSNHVGYADNCATCHHHSGNDTPPCYACHSTSDKLETPDTAPNLKAAYHRQCMDCHKKMGSGPLGCTDCHAKKKQEPAQEKREEKK